MKRKIKLYLFTGCLVLLPFLATHFFVPNKEFNSTKEKFEFTQAYLSGVTACQSYAEILFIDSLNGPCQFAFIKEWIDADRKDRQYMEFNLLRENKFPIEKDLSWRKSKNLIYRNHGLFGRAVLDYYTDRSVDTKLFLD